MSLSRWSIGPAAQSPCPCREATTLARLSRAKLTLVYLAARKLVTATQNTLAGENSMAEVTATRPVYATPTRTGTTSVTTRVRVGLLLVLAAGFAIRLALAPFGGNSGDLDTMRFWAARLIGESLGDFYATPGLVDHLPGDLWILLAVAHLYRLFSSESQFDGSLFLFLLKLVPTVADIGIGLVLFLLGRGFGGPVAGLCAAAFFALNPGSIFLTSIWGQWDSVSALFVLIAVWLFWYGKPECSLPVLAYAALIKPPFAALAPLFVLAFLQRYLLPHTRWADCAGGMTSIEPLSRSVRRGLIALGASLLVMLVVLLPFGVGVPPLPTRWSLFERLNYSLDVWQVVTANAFNFWALWALTSAGEWRPDELPFLFGLSYRAWGSLLTAAAYGAVLLLFWRRSSNRALIWASLAITFALFMLPTRIHERYLFPAVMFAALAAAVSPSLLWLYAVLSLSYLANLYWAYALYFPAPVAPFLYASNSFIYFVSLLNLGALLYVLFRGLHDLQGAQAPVPAVTTGRRGVDLHHDARESAPMGRSWAWSGAAEWPALTFPLSWRATWLWPYGGLGVLLAVVLWPAWFTTQHLIAGNDLLIQHYPWQVLFRDMLAAGEFPFWNPYTFGGVPAFANPLMAYAYPPHWALVWMPAVRALNWLLGLHVVLAGLGAAWCAGRLGASKGGQFLAGVVYALGSAMTARLWAGHFALLEGIAWLPIATGLAIEIRHRWALLLLPIVTALMVFAGQPEVLVFCLWWLPLWAALGSLREGWIKSGLAIAAVGLGLGLGFALAAVQIIPTAALYSVTNRAAGSSWEWTTMASPPPWHLLTVLAPTIFGDPSGYWPGQQWEWHDRLFYIGLVPLLAAVRASGRWRRACWVAAAVAVVLALGRHTHWYGWAQAVLPGYQNFRVPPKHFALAVLALAMAASLGIHRLQGRRVALAALSLAALLVAASQSFAVWFPAVTSLLGGVQQTAVPVGVESMAEMARPGLLTASFIMLLVAIAALLPRLWAGRAQVLLATLELVLVLSPYRIKFTDPEGVLAQADPIRGLARVAVVGNGGAILGNLGTVLQITQPAGYLNLFSGGYSQLATGNSELILFDIARNDPSIPLLGYGTIFDAERQSVTVIQPPPPLAWVARCVWPGGAVDVREPTFPRHACVTLANATERQSVVAPGPAQIVDQRAGWLVVEAEGPGWLVTTQPWYPGWVAWIAGEAVPVGVVDEALVGVPLSPGTHTITLRYRPAGLKLGLAISVVTGVVLLAGWYFLCRRRQVANLDTGQ